MESEAKPGGLEVRTVGETIVVAGELDLATAPVLTEAIAQTTAGAIALDLADVTFIDSSGIGAVVAAHQRLAAAGRELTVARRSPVVARVFDVSGVDAILGEVEA